MPRFRSIVPAALLLVLGACGAHTPPAASTTPANVPGGAASADAQAAAALEGDWVWNGDINLGAANGSFRFTYANARWTGTITVGTYPPAPLTSMTVNLPDLRFTADVNNQQMEFRGRLEGGNTITGTISAMTSMGRFEADRR